MTDTITLTLSLYFLIQGASRGFMNSLAIPLSITLGTILSIIYFQLTRDAITSLIIGIISPLLINFLLKFILKQLAKVTDMEIKTNSLSRLAGALVNLIWGWVFIVFALTLLAVMPPWGKALTDIHNNVIKSASYYIAQPFAKMIFPPPQAANPDATAVNTQTELNSLAQDPRFLEILKDPDIQKEIEAHDIVNLMKNPKMLGLVQDIVGDPATMKKVMALYSSQSASYKKPE